MNAQDIHLLFDYNYWANRRISEMAAHLTPEQFAAPSGYGLASVRGTLTHLLDAERSWRLLLQSNTFDVDLNENEFPTIESLTARWSEEEQAMRAYLASLTDDDMTGIVRYTPEPGVNRERVLWHCLVHVVNHGTQHRSEAAALLTGCGQSPDDLDFTWFLLQRGLSSW